MKLIAPHYVKPFVKRQKNDAADAEAIVIAAQRPEMRFVEPKSAEQQNRAILFRARERLVHQRTELVNAFGRASTNTVTLFRRGFDQLKRIEEILDEPNSDLPELMREECRDLMEQIAEKTVRINARTAKIKALAAEADTARRLQTIPGVGPFTALAVEAFAPPMESFRLWPRLCRLARPRSTPILLRRQRAARSHIEGGAGRHPQAADYRSDVAPELAGPQIDPGRLMAGAHRGAKAKDARRDRFGQQDGADDLGHADEE